MPDQEKLFVRRVGEGEPVLVLSGLGMQSWQWLPFLFSNRNQYEFIIPDWRGFGGSKNCVIPSMDAISSHWNDVDALIKLLNLDQFILMGYSMGATTAMHGMKHGDLAKKLKPTFILIKHQKLLLMILGNMVYLEQSILNSKVYFSIFKHFYWIISLQKGLKIYLKTFDINL